MDELKAMCGEAGSTVTIEQTAIATPPRGGRHCRGAPVRRRSYAVAARVFHPANPAKKVEQAKGYTALFGHFVDREEAFDEGRRPVFPRAPQLHRRGRGGALLSWRQRGGAAAGGSLGEIKQTLEFFGIDKDDENNQKRCVIWRTDNAYCRTYTGVSV